MLLTIFNDRLKLTVDTLGAGMTSLQDRNGTEYLAGTGPQLLFPVTGRLWGDSHLAGGKECPMEASGFAGTSEFLPLVHEGNRLSLALCPSRKMEQQYPFDFCLQISYVLHEEEVILSAKVGNIGEEPMAFGIGGAPVFRIPATAEKEEYCLEFASPCHPVRLGICAGTGLLNGQDRPFSLEDSRRISLPSGLADRETVLLGNTDRRVSLVSRKTGKGVRISFPKMPCLGIRREGETLCLAPGTSLPGREGTLENLLCRSDYLRLEPREIYENQWRIAIL